MPYARAPAHWLPHPFTPGSSDSRLQAACTRCWPSCRSSTGPPTSSMCPPGGSTFCRGTNTGFRGSRRCHRWRRRRQACTAGCQRRPWWRPRRGPRGCRAGQVAAAAWQKGKEGEIRCCVTHRRMQLPWAQIAKKQGCASAASTPTGKPAVECLNTTHQDIDDRDEPSLAGIQHHRPKEAAGAVAVGGHAVLVALVRPRHEAPGLDLRWAKARAGSIRGAAGAAQRGNCERAASGGAAAAALPPPPSCCRRLPLALGTHSYRCTSSRVSSPVSSLISTNSPSPDR